MSERGIHVGAAMHRHWPEAVSGFAPRKTRTEVRSANPLGVNEMLPGDGADSRLRIKVIEHLRNSSRAVAHQPIGFFRSLIYDLVTRKGHVRSGRFRAKAVRCGDLGLRSIAIFLAPPGAVDEDRKRLPLIVQQPASAPRHPRRECGATVPRQGCEYQTRKARPRPACRVRHAP